MRKISVFGLSSQGQRKSDQKASSIGSGIRSLGYARDDKRGEPVARAYTTFYQDSFRMTNEVGKSVKNVNNKLKVIINY